MNRKCVDDKQCIVKWFQKENLHLLIFLVHSKYLLTRKSKNIRKYSLIQCKRNQKA